MIKGCGVQSVVAIDSATSQACSNAFATGFLWNLNSDSLRQVISGR